METIGKKIVALVIILWLIVPFFSYAHSNNNQVLSKNVVMAGASGQTERASANPQDDYNRYCQEYKLNCYIEYGQSNVQNNKAKEPVVKPASEKIAHASSSKPLISGQVAIVVVIIFLVGGILLWLRFGGTGVLLSSAPKEIAVKSEIPTNWNKSQKTTNDQKNDILSDVIQMQDRRLALIELLRLCLLHAAQMSSTRLARSDTERSVMQRLPKELPYRDELEVLLKATELVHYGGQDISASDFELLVMRARNFLMIRKMANA